MKDSSVQQSSIKKNESFKHWYLRHLFANPIVFITVTLITCLLTVINMMIIVLVGTIVNFVVLWIGDIGEGLSLLNVYILRLLFLHLIRFVILSARQTSASWLGWNASKRIKNEFIEHIQNKPMKFHDSVR
ncbi:MAG: ABC transporter transmembrane domain-containing protein, partial [Promethearchaeota archaeon]